MSITEKLNDNLTKTTNFIAANTKLMNAVGHTLFAGSVARIGFDVAGYVNNIGVLETLYLGVAGVAATKLSKIMESNYSSEELKENGYKAREDLQLFELNTKEKKAELQNKFQEKIRNNESENTMSL